ncbi:MAG: hypothetical protein OJF52_003461 [Nitrospira sp.]|nr:MAG: hypothetical protein OJF52_003461 [Nitrospira sp.]
MEKRVVPLDIKVEADSNEVVIGQTYNDEWQGIRIPDEQVDLLIKWLQEAKEELKLKKSSTVSA